MTAVTDVKITLAFILVQDVFVYYWCKIKIVQQLDCVEYAIGVNQNKRCKD
jgi:hypothetical protein